MVVILSNNRRVQSLFIPLPVVKWPAIGTHTYKLDSGMFAINVMKNHQKIINDKFIRYCLATHLSTVVMPAVPLHSYSDNEMNPEIAFVF